MAHRTWCARHVQVCFVFQEVDLYLQSARSKPRSPWEAVKDLAVAVLLGKALPIALNVLLEARSRAAFLRKRCAVCPGPCSVRPSTFQLLQVSCVHNKTRGGL